MPSCDYSFPTTSCWNTGTPKYYFDRFSKKLVMKFRCEAHARSGIHELFDTEEEAIQYEVTRSLCQDSVTAA